MLRIPQNPSITGTSPSDCLVSYPGHSLGDGSYPSAEVQSVYSTAQAEWTKTFSKSKSAVVYKMYRSVYASNFGEVSHQFHMLCNKSHNHVTKYWSGKMKPREEQAHPNRWFKYSQIIFRSIWLWGIRESNFHFWVATNWMQLNKTLSKSKSIGLFFSQSSFCFYKRQRSTIMTFPWSLTKWWGAVPINPLWELKCSFSFQSRNRYSNSILGFWIFKRLVVSLLQQQEVFSTLS